jgi:hypothetical protein
MFKEALGCGLYVQRVSNELIILTINKSLLYRNIIIL